MFTCNNCKHVVNEAKLMFTERMSRCIVSYKFGSHEYWQLCKIVFNMGKSDSTAIAEHYITVSRGPTRNNCIVQMSFTKWQYSSPNIVPPAYVSVSLGGTLDTCNVKQISSKEINSSTHNEETTHPDRKKKNTYINNIDISCEVNPDCQPRDQQNFYLS